MLQSETKTIDGETYRVTQLPFKKGQKLLVRLYKTLGPVVAEALAAIPRIEEGKKLEDLNISTLLPGVAGAATLLAERLTEEDLEYVTATLAEYTLLGKGGDKWVPLEPEMEIHFGGRYRQYLQWMGFALGVNYSGFFGESGGLRALIERVQARAAPSQNTSTGTPTESSPPSATT